MINHDITIENEYENRRMQWGPEFLVGEENSTYDDLIEKAMEDEKQGYVLFSQLSKKMSNEKNKKALELLADEELYHLYILEEHLNQGIESLNYPQTEYRKKIKVEDIELNDDSDLKDILSYAINEEKRAVVRYKELAKKSKDQENHDIFVQLSRFEMLHLVRLENIYKENYGN